VAIIIPQEGFIPFLSYTEKGETRASVPGPVSAIVSKTHRTLFRSTRGKELGLWLGRFHTPRRCSAWVRFFLSFESLKSGHWDLGPELIGTQDSISKEIKVCD